MTSRPRIDICPVPELRCPTNLCVWEWSIEAKGALEKCNAQIEAANG